MHSAWSVAHVHNKLTLVYNKQKVHFKAENILSIPIPFGIKDRIIWIKHKFLYNRFVEKEFLNV